MKFKKVSNVPSVNKVAEGQSGELLKSLINEFNATPHPTTRVGVIAEVREFVNASDKTERLYVMSYNDGFVFMPETQAPEELKSLANEELLGLEVPFKVAYVDKETKMIFVSYVAIAAMYAVAYQKSERLHGTIQTSYYDRDNQNDSYFRISCYGDMVKMKLRDFSAYSIPKYLPAFSNTDINFKVIGAEEDGTILVSKKVLDEEHRDKVIADLEANKNESFVAEIVKIKEDVTYLIYRGVLMTLNDSDFSVDHTPVSLVKQKGDSMLVKVKFISKGKRVFVIPDTKYKAPITEDIKSFSRGEVAQGVVIKRFTGGYFIRIATGIDVYCTTPKTLREPEVGETVRVKITRVYDRTTKDGTTVPSLLGTIKGFVLPSSEFAKEEA